MTCTASSVNFFSNFWNHVMNVNRSPNRQQLPFAFLFVFTTTTVSFGYEILLPEMLLVRSSENSKINHRQSFMQFRCAVLQEALIRTQDIFTCAKLPANLAVYNESSFPSSGAAGASFISCSLCYGWLAARRQLIIWGHLRCHFVMRRSFLLFFSILHYIIFTFARIIPSWDMWYRRFRISALQIRSVGTTVRAVVSIDLIRWPIRC